MVTVFLEIVDDPAVAGGAMVVTFRLEAVDFSFYKVVDGFEFKAKAFGFGHIK